jgi:hypothetical protein
MRERGRYYLFVSLAVAAIFFVFSYPYRYLDGQGALGVVLLAAVGLESAYLSAESRICAITRARLQNIPLIVPILFFMLFSPTLIISAPGRVSLRLLNSTYRNLITVDKEINRPNEYSLALSQYMQELIALVKTRSAPGEIIFTNHPFIGTMVAALADRRDAGGMLREVRPQDLTDPFSNSRLVIWFRDLQSIADPGLVSPVDRHELEKIAETPIAYIYRNKNLNVSGPAITKAVISSQAIALLFLVALCALILDLSGAIKKIKVREGKM